MKILYGVQTTGYGHISRSKKIIDGLQKGGHQVDILVSGGKEQVSLDAKYRFKGLDLVSRDGGINLTHTLTGQNWTQLFRDIRNFRGDYDLVVSDFEPISSWFAKIKGIKLWSISNQNNHLSPNYPRPKSWLRISESVMKWVSPTRNRIGFHWINFDDYIHKPIIRDQILQGVDMGHHRGYYLVYMNGLDLYQIINTLTKLHHNDFVVYSDQVKSGIVVENTRIKPIDFAGFTKDLIKCRGVITTSGFSTISEALYLQKKLMVIPQKNHWEQECNAYNLELSGFFVRKSINQIKDFMDSPLVVIDRWKDPTPDIIRKISC